MAQKTRRSRTTYHHGDLRVALIEAGAQLARAGGPDAVVLREVARIVGVAPNSAYSHFTTLADLKRAVSQQALREMAAAMLTHLATVEEPTDPQKAAESHLREVGRAYVHFALEEPGLFRTAMAGNPAGVGTPGSDCGPIDSGFEGRPKPDSLLMTALGRLTEVGCLPRERTTAAVMASWATVHGLAGILLDLQPELSPAERTRVIGSALDVLLTGLTSE